MTPPAAVPPNPPAPMNAHQMLERARAAKAAAELHSDEWRAAAASEAAWKMTIARQSAAATRRLAEAAAGRKPAPPPRKNRPRATAAVIRTGPDPARIIAAIARAYGLDRVALIRDPRIGRTGGCVPRGSSTVTLARRAAVHHLFETLRLPASLVARHLGLSKSGVSSALHKFRHSTQSQTLEYHRAIAAAKATTTTAS